MKKIEKFTFFPLLFIICYLLFVFTAISCDLINGEKTDILDIIDQEVEWANAEQLTVTVFPGEWGRSPQEGGMCFDALRTKEKPRKGYLFNVEFLPNNNFGFEKWIAVPTDGFAAWFTANKLKSSLVVISPYSADEVLITEGFSETGAITASVVINVTDKITLVPWCGDRPGCCTTAPAVTAWAASPNFLKRQSFITLTPTTTRRR